MRLPIRLRLTLAFGLAMASVLAGTSAFLYLRLERSLDSTLDQTLHLRARQVGAFLDEAPTLAGRGIDLAETGEAMAQVLAPGGRVLSTTPQLRGRPLIDPAVAARAARSEVLVARTRLAGRPELVRLLASPVSVGGHRLVVAVAAPLGGRDAALRQLLTALLIGGPLALVVASLAGYGLATAALRPVESMRRRAAAISAAESGQRLPVPDSGDEIRRLGDTLNAMLERIEDAFARERAFAADASHELRTPLTLLRTEIDLALRRPRGVDELTAALRSAGDETERLSRLAEDLLVLAQADEGRLPLRARRLDALPLLETVARRFRVRAAEGGRRIDVDPDAAVVLTGDPDRLEQALGNLVDNALRHGAGRVVLTAREEDGVVRVAVCDEGPGLPEALRPRAFERFTRGDPARGRGGSGLGLAIVAAIARAHGGTAAVRESPGGGCAVSLELPAA